MTFTLAWTPALPAHYVATLADGSQWLLPVSPIAAQDPRQGAPYRGNYTLGPVWPSCLARLYGSES